MRKKRDIYTTTIGRRGKDCKTKRITLASTSSINNLSLEDLEEEKVLNSELSLPGFGYHKLSSKRVRKHHITSKLFAALEQRQLSLRDSYKIGGSISCLVS